MLKAGLSILCILLMFNVLAQNTSKKDIGLIIGNVLDAQSSKAIAGATVALKRLNDKTVVKNSITDKNGSFELEKLPFGYYRLELSAVGFSSFLMDSIYLREDRFDFNLGDIKMKVKSNDLEEVVIYAEKPLLENKEGKITFNAGESALSAGSSTSELLKTMPLISNDANGKILLKGKEPKILIDDKPTDLNAQQLQDLLESLPGSSIEKIELMTNPPAQYASENGGVINIVTRKGKIGFTGRVNISYGTRGEGNINTNISYRKQKLSINVNAGVAASRLFGGGSSYRTNIYSDSTNYFSTINNFLNKNIRPNLRTSVDYEFDKQRSVNVVFQLAGNYYDNENETEYTNINQLNTAYRISNRTTASSGGNINPFVSMGYQFKGKDVRETLRLLLSYGYGLSDNERDYFQYFMNGDKIPTGIDSTQKQVTDNNNHNTNFRIDYNKPLKWMNALISTGATIGHSLNNNLLVTSYLKKPDSVWTELPLLSNDFKFTQTISTARAGITLDLKKQWKLTTGAQLEHTQFAFDFTKTNDNANSYINLLPNLTIRKDWNRVYNIAFVYRKTLRRPGTGELNPSIDVGDPYNLRFGNPSLLPQRAHNFDINAGKTKGKFYINSSLGFNLVEDIIQSIRTLQSDGKTFITYENITDRKEYEASIFGGYTFSKALRLNASAGYSYNVYSEYDQRVNRYRNGASFYGSVNYNIVVNDRLSFDGVIRYNSIANPQGNSRSNVNQNIGMQVKFLNKRLFLNISLIDIFSQQQFNSYTEGSNFILSSQSNSRSRNIRTAISYNLNKNKTRVSSKQNNELYKRLNKMNGSSN